MLKIKDNVDLKKLKKYGFLLDDNEWYRIYVDRVYIYVKPLSREILLKARNSVDFFDVTVIYNLIKDDLVENVSGC